MSDLIKPNAIVIGTAKCGTTYLYNLLAQHPAIKTSKKKELTFFSSNASYNKADSFLSEQYAGYSGENIILDNTPIYIIKPFCAKRIKSFSGSDAKIICMLRNPVNRAFSGYMHSRVQGLEKDTFASFVTPGRVRNRVAIHRCPINLREQLCFILL